MGGAALNRAFATPYLDEALTSLGKIVGAVQRWSVIKWGLFTAMFIYLLAPALVVYQQQGVMDFERAHLPHLPDTGSKHRPAALFTQGGGHSARFADGGRRAMWNGAGLRGDAAG